MFFSIHSFAPTGCGVTKNCKTNRTKYHKSPKSVFFHVSPRSIIFTGFLHSSFSIPQYPDKTKAIKKAPPGFPGEALNNVLSF
jgi:hypothetical protein